MIGELLFLFFSGLGIGLVPVLVHECPTAEKITYRTVYEPIRCYRDKCSLETTCDYDGLNCYTSYECSLGEFECPEILEEYYGN